MTEQLSEPFVDIHCHLLPGIDDGSENWDQSLAMEALCQLPNAYFKFVVTEPGDVDEVCLLRDKYGLPNQRILLMPEGTTVADIESRSPWVSEACVKEGFRFSTRLHILLWGDKRGR